MIMEAKEVIELIKDTEIVNFDITITGENIDINEIARLCGEKMLEFYIYEDTTTHKKKLIRIRN